MIRAARTLVLYPILIGILPVFVLFTSNLNSITFSETYRALTAAFCISVSLLLLLRLVLKDWHRAGLVVTVFLFSTLNFGHLTSVMISLFSLQAILLFQISVAIVASFQILGIWYCIRVLRKPKIFTFPLNLVTACWILLNLSIIGLDEVRSVIAKPSIRQETIVASAEAQGANTNKRDIYYIILDGYARSDILQELYGVDSSDFLSRLSSLGFYVADESHSNYSQTILSISSSLNMQYLDQMITIDPGSSDRSPITEMLRNSQVRKFLKDKGYRVVAFDSGYKDVSLYDADTYIHREFQLTEFENLLINNTLAIFIKVPMVRSLAYNGIITQFNQLKEIASEPGPKFVFAHFMIPHPPFLFDENGILRDKSPVEINDGSDFTGSKEDYRKGYREQVLYATRQIESVLEVLLSQPGPKPIIVLQGDHGSGLYLDQHSFQNTCIRERLGNLNVYYLPEGGEVGLYPTITPVNTFRVIFNEYFDTNLPLIKDISYYSQFDYPFQFQEVSEEQLNYLCEQKQAKQ